MTYVSNCQEAIRDMLVQNARKRSTPRKRENMRQDRLQEMMNARGFSQLELAKRAKLSQRQVARYLAKGKDRSDPTLGAAAAMAKALNCSLDWLAGLSD